MLIGGYGRIELGTVKEPPSLMLPCVIVGVR